MKPLRTLASIFLTCCIFLPFCPRKVSGTDSAAVRALFRNPPRQYSTGPLWVWNDLLTEEQIRDTLRDLAGQKIKQVWVHPRPGLMTPYLSADWFRLWKVALQEAERLDMNLWIYDENSYPSGFAGGFVPEAMPESRGRGVLLHEAKMAPSWSEDLIAIYRADTNWNISSRVRAGEALAEGSYVLATQTRAKNSPWHGNRCYVNLLSPGVTEKFLELTLEAYRRELGGQFGKRIPGVFTDEPNIRPAEGLPWSEILPQKFKERWGYDLLDHLCSLTRTVGDWRKIRHNYFQVLNEQFIEHWSKPYFNYCETNHLEWTGHYWDHEWPNCVGVPDNMAMYAWHQRPAIDCLMNQYSENTHAQFGNVRMVRELSSIANQLGKNRTLCEVYGAGGWDLRFEDMKRISDWLEVLGVNTLNQHLSYVTLRGARKRDHPQSFSYHEPWWDAYHISAEYFARLSAALSQGQQVNRVLVLEPTTTAWMYQGEQAQLQKLGDAFCRLLMSLEAAQVEYDIGCEDVIGRCGAVVPAGPGKSELRVGARSYAVVVIPPLTENLQTPTVGLLEQLVNSQSPGEVICLGDAPVRVDGAPSERGASVARRQPWRKIEPETTADLLAGPAYTEGFDIHRKMGDRGILFHHRRRLDDGELLFLVNTSLESPTEGSFVSQKKGIEQWNLSTGSIQPYAFEKGKSAVVANFALPPSGSLLLFLSNKEHRPSVASQEIVTVVPPVSSPEARRLDPNVLTLDFVDVTAGGQTRSNSYFYQANQFAWKANGMERNPWDSAVQFKDELIARKFPAESGFEASYRFTIQSAVPTNLAVVIERPDLYSITCNDQTLKWDEKAWWLDKAFGRMPIASTARCGENVVTLKASPFTMFHELEPAYILGDFTLRPLDKGFAIAPYDIGSLQELRGWNEQGHPFYSSGIAYRERFYVEKPSGRYVVALGKWRGSVSKVSVNGKMMGYIDTAPWECDVTGRIKRGTNHVEVVVVGTLKNTLGPHHGNPALGAAWPTQFQKGPESGPPPGSAYSTVAYGLFEPFVLKRAIHQNP